MEKEKSSLEIAHQIIMEVRADFKPKKKSRKKNSKMVETDIDLFAKDAEITNTERQVDR